MSPNFIIYFGIVLNVALATRSCIEGNNPMLMLSAGLAAFLLVLVEDD
jgi:hypothetical protein